MPAPAATPARLVVLDPPALRGRSVPVGAGTVLVGRDPGSSLVLDDPHVSRRHAALRRVGPDLVLEDLGSTAGTRLNQRPLRGPSAVHNGDVIAVAGVTLRYEGPGGAPEPTQAFEAVPPAAVPSEQARFDVRDQYGQYVSNVGGDQYNYQQHVTHVQQVRESFLREVAAAKSKARTLIWLGLILAVAGGVVYGVVFARAASAIGKGLGDAFRAGPGDIPQPPDVQIFGPDVGGVPLALAGLFLVAIGGLLIVIGMVLHVTATARGRRIDQRHPLPVPPGAYPPPYPASPPGFYPASPPFPSRTSRPPGPSDRPS